jgi:hypothetical protein
VWRPRILQYSIMAAGWLVVAVVFAATGGGALVVGVLLAASVLSVMVAIKAAVLVSRNKTTSG